MFHKRLLAQRLDLTWEGFAAQAHRDRKCDFNIYFRADEASLDAELEWAMSHRSVMLSSRQNVSREGELSCFDKGLTDMELQRKTIYEQLLPTGRWGVQFGAISRIEADS